MRTSKFFTLVLVLCTVLSLSAIVHADDYDFAYKRLGELETLTEAASGDLTLVYDTSTAKGKTMDAANPVVSGDVTFQSNLLAAGRKNGASTVSSSSTNLAPSTLPYTIVRKCIGGAGGLDASDGGTRLQNGTSGQMLVLVAITREGTGSWIVTPATSLTFKTLTFDAVGETTTLLYVDDTVGWIVFATSGTTVDPVVTDFL